MCTGGITTLIDMPLNSFPSTVSTETLKLKVCLVHIDDNIIDMISIIYLNAISFDRLRLQRRVFMLMLVCSMNCTLINLYLKD